MIGGSDKVLWVDEAAPAAELIVRAVRSHWPQYVFQNSDDDHATDPSQLPTLPAPTGREFFLYRLRVSLWAAAPRAPIPTARIRTTALSRRS